MKRVESEIDFELGGFFQSFVLEKPSAQKYFAYVSMLKLQIGQILT